MRNTSDFFLDDLVKDLSPVTPLRQRTGMALALSALALGAILVLSVLNIRADFAAGQPKPLPLISAGVFLVLALASAWTAIDMARPAVGTRREGWGWTALMAGVLPASALGLLALQWSAEQAVALTWGEGECLLLGSMVGLLTAATLVLWLRRGAPSSPERAGLLTGVASGAAGIFAVSLWCPHDSVLHIGLWHGATVIGMGLAGRLIVPKLIAW
jgi:hypothetical protein